MSKQKRDVISRVEIDEYLDHKAKYEIMHDQLMSRLQRGALIAQDSPVELFLVEFNARRIDWEAVAKRLIRRVYITKDKVERYLAKLVKAAPLQKVTQLRNRRNNLFLPEAARETVAAGD